MCKADLSRIRCSWCNLKNPVYVAYHDEEWGVPCHEEKKLYEMFLLETFQAGLSWECILNKRENYRKAYDDFAIDKVCAYDERKIEELMNDAGIVRNRRKIEASIANSIIYRGICREFGSFDNYLSSFTKGKITYQNDPKITTSELSDRISLDLKKRGMKFTGSVTIYSYLQAIGVINAHAKECFRYSDREK